MRSLVTIVLALTPSMALSLFAFDGEREKAIAAVKKLGGKVESDGLIYLWGEKVTDDHLIMLAAIPELRRLP